MPYTLMDTNADTRPPNAIGEHYFGRVAPLSTTTAKSSPEYSACTVALLRLSGIGLIRSSFRGNHVNHMCAHVKRCASNYAPAIGQMAHAWYHATLLQVPVLLLRIAPLALIHLISSGNC